MRSEQRHPIRLVFACILAAAFAAPALADSAECAKCHAPLFEKKMVHRPARKACDSCHVAMDAASPHQVRGKVAKGLAMEPGAQCLTCHEDELGTAKVVHAPVASGNCLSCHDPHAADHAGLLKREPAAICLTCHTDVQKKPHVIVGLSGGGHPLGDAAKSKETADPLRPGKKFSCVSCHEPHRSDLPMLTRLPKGMSSCQKCHKM
jgi:predicted CXXCH cytochrome family protein